MAQSLFVLALLGAVFVCAQFSLVSSGCPGSVAALASTNGRVATLRTEPHQCPADDCCDIECPYGLLGLVSIITGIPNNLVCGTLCGCSCPDGEPGAQASCSNQCGFSVCGTLCGGCKCKSKCCPEGWNKFNNYCYKYFTPAAANQDAAEASCVANGGHLASIHSAAENTFINDLVIPDTHFFTGLEVGHEGADWKFTCSRYTDGTKVDYGADPAAQGIPPWCPGSPKNFQGISNCVKSHSEPGQNNCWNDWKCTDPMTYVCKKPAACA